jgi:hypothetical protein
MPNHSHSERADLYAEEATALKAEITDLYVKLRRQVEDNQYLEIEIEKHANVHAENIILMDKMRREGALIVHALDRAFQLTEVLMAFWPAGVPMHPSVVSCKAQLDEAMRKIIRPSGAKP